MFLDRLTPPSQAEAGALLHHWVLGGPDVGPDGGRPAARRAARALVISRAELSLGYQVPDRPEARHVDARLSYDDVRPL